MEIADVVELDFKKIKTAVSKQFGIISKSDLYRTDVSKDDLWACYLASFPEGTNPIYKERTVHDCNCCKNFIRAVGNAVAIIDGKLVSVWDIDMGLSEVHGWQIVVDKMAELAKSQGIKSVFYHFEPKAGTDKSLVDTLNGVVTWNHFFVNLPSQLVLKGAEIATAIGEKQAIHDVFARSLASITDEAVTTVLDLIAQNSLYRGEEHREMVKAFKRVKAEYSKIKTDEGRDKFVWFHMLKVPGSVARMRNTVIGTLLSDLSEGLALEDAVKMFEAKVAPANYKRPTALVTKAMIDSAKETLEELGLVSSLERRYAVVEDITVNNILYANRTARKSMKADVFEELTGSVRDKAPKKLDKVEEVPIDKFIKDILPQAETIELFLENRHGGNLVSLIAPVDGTAKKLFKWDNPFSWSYNGEFADSIKERVKAAGGSVVGDLCCRLAWDYEDDLDFHMYEPGGGHIYFSNRRHTSVNGGMLDVDANGIDGVRPNPVENIFYATKSRMREGVYRLEVNNYNRRSSGSGFEVEIEFEGEIFRMGYDKVLRNQETVAVAEIEFSKSTGFKILRSLPTSQSVRQMWGVSTQTYQPVNVVMLSPNYWDGHGVGNKHYFFMLEGVVNEGQARGFFNEFLTEDLTKHRKVIEMVGSKMKTDNADRQLSGLGFSSTQRNNVLCRVKGSFSRVINLAF